MSSSSLIAAKSYAKHGLSVIACDSVTKKAVRSWEPFMRRIPAEEELASMFTNGQVPALICGHVSGNLELLDFDVPGAYHEWRESLIDNNQEALSDKLNLVIQTPRGGYHVIYRSTGPVEGNMKLAHALTDPGTNQYQVSIETRGEGGYFLTIPSPARVKLSGSWNHIPVITPDERDTILSIARMLDQRPAIPKYEPKVRTASGDRPGDLFNAEADFDALLLERGFRRHSGGTRGNEGYTRPGKDQGVSVTVKDGLLYVFSSNCLPLEPSCSTGHAYRPFDFLTVWDHNGDFSACAKALSDKGFKTNKDEWKSTAQQFSEYIQGTGVQEDLSEGFDVCDIEDFEAERPEWLIEGLLRVGQINLIDAAGSTGKTTLILAIAAAGSNGFDPWGNKIEPFKTLYFGNEDPEGEIRQKYESLGGKKGYLKIVSQYVTLNPIGMQKLEETILKTGAKFVVFDPLRSYVSGVVRNQLDGLQWIPIFSALRKVSQATHTCITNIRHFAALTKGREFSEMGSGVAEWRNCHRTQLVLWRHPDREKHPFYVYVLPCRGSINAMTAEPIGFEIVGGINGVFGWDTSPDMEPIEEQMGKKPSGSRGPQQTARLDASAWLKDRIKDGPVKVATIRSEMEAKGWNSATMYRAASEIKTAQYGGYGNITWEIYDEYKDEAPSKIWGAD